MRRARISGPVSKLLGEARCPGRRRAGSTVHPGEELTRTRVDLARAGADVDRGPDIGRSRVAHRGDRLGRLDRIGATRMQRIPVRGGRALGIRALGIRAGLHEKPGYRYGIAVNGHRTMVRTSQSR